MVTKKQLIRLHEKFSQQQIAKVLGISPTSVYRLMRKYKLKSRTSAQASSFMNNQRTVEFTKQQEQLVFGSLLGDACLARSRIHSNKTNRIMIIYKLHFAHCQDQLPYLIHKTRLAKSPNTNQEERIITSRHKSEALVFLRNLQPFILPCFNYKIRALHGVLSVPPQCLQNHNQDTGIKKPLYIPNVE